MQRIYDIEDVGMLHNQGEYNAAHFDLLAVARVLNDERLMYSALRGPAMLTIKATNKATSDAAKAVTNPNQFSMAPLDLAAIRKQALHWLIAHGTTLTALKQDYDNATYTSRYTLGLRTLTYYKVPEILADLIARTGEYEQRELMEA